jgi:hypothetical protein
MITQLTQNQRRGLAIGILVLLITLFYLLAINPILALHRYYDETISDLSFQISRFEGIATSQSVDQAAMEKLLRRNSSQRYYLKNSKPALASTELQQPSYYPTKQLCRRCCYRPSTHDRGYYCYAKSSLFSRKQQSFPLPG